MRWVPLVCVLFAGCGGGGTPTEGVVRVAVPGGGVPEPAPAAPRIEPPPPPARTALDWPAASQKMPCTDAGSSWDGVEGELSFGVRGETPVVAGELRFVGRSATLELEGHPKTANDETATYLGSMKEVGGVGTVWRLELEVVAVGAALRGTLFEVVELDPPRKDVICHVDIDE